MDTRSHEAISGASISIFSDTLRSGFELSDDRGHFAFKAITPGRYRIEANHQGYIAYAKSTDSNVLTLEPTQQVKDFRIELTPTAVIMGQITNDDGIPQANLTLTAVRPQYEDGKRTLSFCGPSDGFHAKTDDLGNYRLYDLEPGSYYLVLHPNNCDKPPQFYPGVTDANDAVPIEALPGATLRFDARWRRAESYSIRLKAIEPPIPGTVSTGFRANARLVMHTNNDLNVRVLELTDASPMFHKDTDGRYTITDLPRGSYTVYFGTDVLFSHIARFDAVIVDHDIDVGTISLLPLVEGFNGRVSGGLSPTLLAKVHVLLHAADGPFPSSYFRSNQSAPVMQPGGKFEISRLPGQRYFVDVSGLPADAYLATARYGGEDVLAQGILLDSQPTGPLELEVRENGGSVEGLVSDDKHIAFKTGTAALIPTGIRSTNKLLFRTSSINDDGKYSIRGIPPGEYLLLGWEKVQPGAWENERFLESFAPRSVRVVVREGIQNKVDIRGISRD